MGAAIAMGSQGEKGKIALFVIKVISKKRTKRNLGLKVLKIKKS